MDANRDELEKIDLTNIALDVMNCIKKLWWLVLILTVIFAAKEYLTVSINYVPVYKASATMSLAGMDATGVYTNYQSASEMAELFPHILTSSVLKDVVAQDLGLDSIPGTISAEADSGLNLLTLSVTGSDPQMTYDILHSVIDNYPKVAEFVVGKTKLNILDETGVPEDSGKETVLRGSYKRGALKGASIGLLIMAVYVLSRRTVKSRKELKRKINLADYGSLPYVHKKKRKKTENNSLTLKNERLSMSYLESVRKLRNKVERVMTKKSYRSLLITSSVPGEGKTTVAVNLALAFAKQGKEVILVDCDMRNPSVATVLEAEGEHIALSSVINEEVSPDKAMVTMEAGKGELKILFGMKTDAKKTRLLGSDKMRVLIEELENQADIVILDTAPAELLSDAAMMAKYVDAALYVVRYDHAKIREGIRNLDLSDVPILGFVFNGDKAEHTGNYGYGGYGYGRYGSYGNYSRYGYYQRKEEDGKKSDRFGRVMKE